MPMPPQPGQPQPQPGQQPQGGMLAQAAQAAAAVPNPMQQQQSQEQPAPPTPTGMPPGPVEQAQGASGEIPQAADIMPESGPAYEPTSTVGDEEPTDRERREYERVAGAMQRALYEEDSIADAVMKQLDPNDKISTAIKASALLVQQIDEKLDMDEIIIPQITMDAVSMITELAENRFGIQFSAQDEQAVLGATWEGVMAMFGVNERDYNELMQEYGGQLDSLQTDYDGFLAQGKPNPGIQTDKQLAGAQPAPAPANATNPGAPPVPMGGPS